MKHIIFFVAILLSSLSADAQWNKIREYMDFSHRQFPKTPLPSQDKTFVLMAKNLRALQNGDATWAEQTSSGCDYIDCSGDDFEVLVPNGKFNIVGFNDLGGSGSTGITGDSALLSLNSHGYTEINSDNPITLSTPDSINITSDTIYANGYLKASGGSNIRPYSIYRAILIQDNSGVGSSDTIYRIVLENTIGITNLEYNGVGDYYYDFNIDNADKAFVTITPSERMVDDNIDIGASVTRCGGGCGQLAIRSAINGTLTDFDDRAYLELIIYP